MDIDSDGFRLVKSKKRTNNTSNKLVQHKPIVNSIEDETIDMNYVHDLSLKIDKLKQSLSNQDNDFYAPKMLICLRRLVMDYFNEFKSKKVILVITIMKIIK